MGEVSLAITASILFGSGSVFARRGLTHGSFVGGMLVSLTSGLMAALAILLFYSPSAMVPEAMALFALAGVAAPGIGRLIAFVGMSTLGAARSVPLQASTYPLVATMAGWFLFEETISPFHWLGVLGIVTGIVVIGGGAPADGSSRRRTTRMLAIPIAAGLVYALGDVVRATGLRVWDEPVVGATVGLAAALAAWLAAIGVSSHLRSDMGVGRGAPWFVLSGICSAAAITTLFLALSVGRVSVVSPIVAMQPLFVVLLAALLLRETETVDIRRWLGAMITVVGTVVVIMSRTPS